MEGARFERVELRRRNLRRPFPRDFAARLTGRTVRALRAARQVSARRAVVGRDAADAPRACRARSASSGDGDARPRRRADAHDHVVFHMSSGAAVTFNDPRRFGVMDLVPAGSWRAHPALGALGPEPLVRDVRRRRAGARLRRQAHVAQGRRCSISGWSPASATSTRARRCTAPGCRRAGAPRRLRRRRARRRRAPTAWRGRSSRCCAGPFRGCRRNPRRAGRGFASTIARAIGAPPAAATEPSGDSRRRGVRRSTVPSASCSVRLHTQ